MKKQAINEVMALKAEKRKKRKKVFKRIFAVVKLVTILAIIVSAVGFTALSPLFNINSVEVKGAVYYNKEELVDLSGIIKGENGFKSIGSSPLNIIRFRFGKAEKIIKEECPYVKDVKVRFAVPSNAVIEITERKAFFRVSITGTGLLIDKEGYVLERLEKSDLSTYPLLNGLDSKEYKLGQKLMMNNAKALYTAVEIMEAIKEHDKSDETELLNLVDSIDASDPASIEFVLDSRIIVKIGGMDNLNYRLSATKTLYNKNIRKSEKGILDFTSGKEPVFSPDDGG